MAVAIVFCWCIGIVDAAGLSVRGALETDAIVQYASEYDRDSSFSFAGLNLLTLTMESEKTSPAKVEATLDIYLLYGTYAASYMPIGEPTGSPLTFGQAATLFYFRTLYASLYFPNADLTIGRQIVNLGKGTVFSPLDVFSQVNIFDIGFRRSGSDIAMVSVPVGTLSGIDAVAEFPTPNREHSSAVVGFTTWNDWDVSAVGIYRHLAQEIVAGISFKGDAFVGLYGELVENYSRMKDQWSFEGMVGSDYSIGTRWLFTAEYLYRQRELLFDPLRDTHNLYALIQFSINDLSNISGVVIGAFPNTKGIATLLYSNNILQRVNTYWYVRYYNLERGLLGAPEGEVGARVTVSF